MVRQSMATKEQRLKRLAELFEKGQMSAVEFVAERKKILDDKADAGRSYSLTDVKCLSAGTPVGATACTGPTAAA